MKYGLGQTLDLVLIIFDKNYELYYILIKS